MRSIGSYCNNGFQLVVAKTRATFSVQPGIFYNLKIALEVCQTSHFVVFVVSTLINLEHLLNQQDVGKNHHQAE
jgi:hypothetical protein